MRQFRERFGYSDLRPGRMYVMHEKGKNSRCELHNETALCDAIQSRLDQDPDATLVIIQLPAQSASQAAAHSV